MSIRLIYRFGTRKTEGQNDRKTERQTERQRERQKDRKTKKELSFSCFRIMWQCRNVSQCRNLFAMWLLYLLNPFLFLQKVKSKDAGFVYDSLRNESSNLEKKFSRNESTTRIFQKRIHDTNPRYESLRFVVTNPDSRIQILRIRKDSYSRIFIFKDSFRAIVLRIRKDS